LSRASRLCCRRHRRQVRKNVKRRQQQSDLRAGRGDADRVIAWMSGEVRYGFC
jgi:hypothetical protein